MKRSANWWSKHFHHRILDPDGWRLKDGVTLRTPITRAEYLRRLQLCTVDINTLKPQTKGQ